jgi:hypothetical protein
VPAVVARDAGLEGLRVERGGDLIEGLHQLAGDGFRVPEKALG